MKQTIYQFYHLVNLDGVLRVGMAPKRRQIPTSQIIVAKPTSSLMQTVKDGLGFGLGQGIAHTVVSRLFTNNQRTIESNIEFKECMKEKDDYDVCAKFMRD